MQQHTILNSRGQVFSRSKLEQDLPDGRASIPLEREELSMWDHSMVKYYLAIFVLPNGWKGAVSRPQWDIPLSPGFPFERHPTYLWHFAVNLWFHVKWNLQPGSIRRYFTFCDGIGRNFPIIATIHPGSRFNTTEFQVSRPIASSMIHPGSIGLNFNRT
jgi:hypothetical protein